VEESMEAVKGAGKRMSREELVEALSDKEHASWARWMEYLFSKCETYMAGDSLVIPGHLVRRWRGQVETPYSELSEQEKESDRKEVAHILPIIEAYRQEQFQQIISIVERTLDEATRATESDWPNILANGLESIVTRLAKSN